MSRSIWDDPEVKAARDLNWVAVHHMIFVQRYTQQGDLETAAFCDRYSACFFDLARRRLRVIRRQRSPVRRFLAAFWRITTVIFWTALMAALLSAPLWLPA